jgi:glucosamine-6-phosphate deaminase
MTREHHRLLKQFAVDRLRVKVYPNRRDLGVAAARAVARRMRFLLKRQMNVRIVFASAPSQNEFLHELGVARGLDWARVTAFHMDEYIGLDPSAPQSFSRFLKDRLYDRVNPGVVHSLNGLASDLQAECKRYARLLNQAPIDIVCAGIGENGHLAFNDPPYADFQDRATVKSLPLALRSRKQQVHDGCFASLDAVPTRAMTLTIPALMAANRVYCIVPGPTKAEAVRATLSGPVVEDCPASVLRHHRAAMLYLDCESSALYLRDSD